MTPQERKLVSELFDRLQSLENTPRDNDAVDAINEGVDRAPNALYPLVQTVLVQDEALKRADVRIRELEEQLNGEPQQAGQSGFLDSMRDTLLGKREPQGSVPSVRSSSGESKWGSAYNQSADMPLHGQPSHGQPQQGQPQYGQPMQQSGGGSFLGTAAATAAGVVGGALLMNSFRGMFGGQQHGQADGAFDQQSGTAPWGQNSSKSDLARDAGVDDVGRGGRQAAASEPGSSDPSSSERYGLFDTASDDGGDVDFDDGDFGGGDD